MFHIQKKGDGEAQPSEVSGLLNAKTSGTTVAQLYNKEINGKTIVITGPTTGTLGGECAMSIALHHPAELILLGRNEDKAVFVEKEAKKLSQNTRVEFVECDLSDLGSVKSAAQQVLSAVGQIDILVNVAGVLAGEYGKTAQGIETQLGTNHIAPFLLTNLLLPKIATGGRIINVTSSAYEMSLGFNFDDYGFSDGATYDSWKAYAQSKTANLLFTAELAKRLASRNICAFAVHPGLVPDTNFMSDTGKGALQDASRLWQETHPGSDGNPDHPKTLQQGVSTILYAAFEPQLASQSGAYLADCAVQQPKPFATEPEAADKLWSLSEDLVGEKFT